MAVNFGLGWIWKRLHMALQGVVENVKRRRWRSARYAVNRRWCLFGEEEVCFGTEGSDG